ncbi:sensor histidine kinase [Nocardiopsis rhodophaea]|uniref:sensor histidine kinase n=1 Tax=Nocardiopsis rhodophaea TaxID=280238 RepID=UPI0031E2BF35
MAQPPSSAGRGDQPLPPQPSQNGDHPLSHMMRVEAAAPPPSDSGWRRFLRRIGVGRKVQPPASPTPGVRPGYPLHQPPSPPHPGAGSGPQPVPPYGAQPQTAPPAPAPMGPSPSAPQAPPAVATAPTPETPPAVPASGPVPVPDRADLLTGTLAGLAMRDLALVDSLIEVVEELEDSSEDPTLLDKLFRIDNLATRMRRNGENLLVLAGQDSGDTATEPVPLLDVARAAISEISEYQRVRLGHLPDLFISGAAADDISHLIAELMDNATEKSPDHAQVVISAQAMGEDQLLITVEDEGIGIPPDRLEAYNSRLRGEPVLDEEVIRHMGFYVVSRIAHRHGLQVQLEGRAFRGISAHVVVPSSLFGSTGPRPVEPPVGRSAHSLVRPVSPSMSLAPSDGSLPRRPTPSVPGSEAQENNRAMESSVTAAGLPRRSAHRNTAPLPLAGPETSVDGTAGDGNGAPASKAERIRADLEGFIEGQEAAGSGSDE